LRTRTDPPWVWSALGDPGLEELKRIMGEDQGRAHFGHRLGAFARDLAIMFQPRTVGFSGGHVARYWPVMEEGVREAFNAWWPVSLLVYGEPPGVFACTHTESALAGLSELAPDSGRA
jgi:hypothetical protein